MVGLFDRKLVEIVSLLLILLIQIVSLVQIILQDVHAGSENPFKAENIIIMIRNEGVVMNAP